MRLQRPGDIGVSAAKAWITAPDDHTAAQWITEHDWFGDSAQAELLHAAVDGDLPRALAVELRPGREADLLRLAHQFTAGQIRAGMVARRRWPTSSATVTTRAVAEIIELPAGSVQGAKNRVRCMAESEYWMRRQSLRGQGSGRGSVRRPGTVP